MYPRWFPYRLTYLLVVVTLPGLESQNPTTAECGENVTLPCKAAQSPIRYRAVTWYKVASRDSGIITKNRNSGKVSHYLGARKAWFEAGESLFMPSVSPDDSGRYKCFLAAEVNQENRDSTVLLSISECVTFASTVTAGTTPEALTTVTGVNISHHLSTEQVEVSLVMIITGFSLVAFAKVILSTLSIWVLHLICERKERRRNQWT